MSGQITQGTFHEHTHTWLPRTRRIRNASISVCVCVRVNKELINVPQTAIGNSWEMLAALSGLCCSLCWLANISIIFSFRSMKCGPGIAMKFLLDLPKQQSQHRNGKQKRIYKSHPPNTYKSKMLRYLWTFLLFFVFCFCLLLLLVWLVWFFVFSLGFLGNCQANDTYLKGNRGNCGHKLPLWQAKN